MWRLRAQAAQSQRCIKGIATTVARRMKNPLKTPNPVWVELAQRELSIPTAWKGQQVRTAPNPIFLSSRLSKTANISAKGIRPYSTVRGLMHNLVVQRGAICFAQNRRSANIFKEKKTSAKPNAAFETVSIVPSISEA